MVLRDIYQRIGKEDKIRLLLLKVRRTTGQKLYNSQFLFPNKMHIINTQFNEIHFSSGMPKLVAQILKR
jgi:hypothetical protein